MLEILLLDYTAVVCLVTGNVDNADNKLMVMYHLIKEFEGY